MPLFAPVIRRYRAAGVTVLLTAREHSQTLELLDLHGFAGTYTVIGRHTGSGKAGKIVGTLRRAAQLTAFARRSGESIGAAVSHGSRSLVLAARWLGLPTLTMYDYEFTETSIFNRFSTGVLVPAAIPDDILDKIGLRRGKRSKYPGIKEELYIRSFVPDGSHRHTFLAGLGLEDRVGDVLVVLRPPATTANYHDEQSVRLFEAVLTRLLTTDGVLTAIVPRTVEQAAEVEAAIARLRLPVQNAVFVREAVDGLQLAFSADLLISGGGTMNREAALLGVPVYSIFAGRLGSLDAQMEKEGSIRFIRTEADVADITLAQRDRGEFRSTLTDRVEEFVIAEIDELLSR